MSYNGPVDVYRAGCCCELAPGAGDRSVPCDRRVAYAGRYRLDDGRYRRVFACEQHRDAVADPVPYGLPVHLAEMERRQKRAARWS